MTAGWGGQLASKMAAGGWALMWVIIGGGRRQVVVSGPGFVAPCRCPVMVVFVEQQCRRRGGPLVLRGRDVLSSSPFRQSILGSKLFVVLFYRLTYGPRMNRG